MRPSTWHPKPENALWLDLATGIGQTRDGLTVKLAPGGRRKNLAAQDVLDHCKYHGFGRVVLVSEPKKSGRDSWFAKTGPGWKAERIHTDSPMSGTYSSAEPETIVAIRSLSEWFGGVQLTPAQARCAWDELEKLIAKAQPDGALFNTPSATGRHLWALTVRKDGDVPSLPPDILEEIHQNAGQHYKAHLVAGPSFPEFEDCVPLIDPKKTRTIPNFAEVDGRVMYASLMKELGAGPAIRVKADTCRQIFSDPRRRFTRGRFLVRFRVPEGWRHIGLLGVKDPASPTNWLHPNRPGAAGESWVDSVEADLARRMGWEIEPIEGVVFDKGRPLDLFSDRMNRVLAAVDADQEYNPLLRKALHNAVRAIILQTIGAFASRGTSRTIGVEKASEIPPEYQHTASRAAGGWKYEVPPEMTDYQRGFYHPEFAAQIWARSRVKVMDTTSAMTDRKTREPRAGALHVRPGELIGIQGDALYLGVEATPQWARPARQGGGDDGAVGRLRLKSALRGPVPTPVDVSARTVLHERAAREWSAS